MGIRKENKSIHFRLGQFEQFKEDICETIKGIEERSNEKIAGLETSMKNEFKAVDGKIDGISSTVNDLNMWRIKVITATSVITTIVCYILSKIF